MDFLNQDINIGKIVLAIKVPAGTGTAVHRNRPSHGLAFHCGGKRIFHFSDGADVSVQTNDLIYLPKYSDYVVETLEPGDCFAINFEMEPDGVFPPQSSEIPAAYGILNRFQSAAELWHGKSAGYELKIKSILYDILYYLFSLSRVPTEKRFETIAPAVAYLENGYTDPALTVTFLANLCNVSDTYFRAVFTEQFGLTPVKYITAKRMALAEALLAEAMHTVGEVQRICGFEDAGYFSRVFKQYAGCAPREYIKRIAP